MGEPNASTCWVCGGKFGAEDEEESSEADSSDQEDSADKEGLVWPASTPGDPSVCILCAEPLRPPRGMVVHRDGRCGYAARWRCIEAVAHARPRAA